MHPKSVHDSVTSDQILTGPLWRQSNFEDKGVKEEPTTFQALLLQPNATKSVSARILGAQHMKTVHITHILRV